MTTTPANSRRTMRATKLSKGDRRERTLLNVAGMLLASGEFAQSPLADIASKAGITRATFYFYFASKQSLLAAFVDEAIAGFNSRIAAVVADDSLQDPADSVRATVHAARELWSTHGAVLVTSVELGTSSPDVYDRTMDNFAAVRTPTVVLLRRHGRVPEADDDTSAAELVTVLMMMTERCFFDLARIPSPVDKWNSVTERLCGVWLRAFGISA